MVNASSKKEAPSANDAAINVGSATLDAQKECLEENPLADLSPDYTGLFHSGDPGVHPIVGGIVPF